MALPFNRDQQIELMRTSADRHARRMQEWMANSAVVDVVCRPAPGQREETAYTVRHERIAYCR